MRKIRRNSKNEKLTDILKLLTKRIEEATIDIHEMKSDLKMVSLRLSNVESNTKITKVDIEKMRREIDDLININSKMLAKMVTHEEFENLSQRVATLEN